VGDEHAGALPNPQGFVDQPRGAARAVLVVSADRGVRDALADAVEAAGSGHVRAVLAADGPEALVAVRGIPASLIVVDLAAPGPRRFDLCRDLKQGPKLQDVPLVAVSASWPSRLVREEGLAAGCSEVVGRHWGVEALRDAVARYLGE
jgi:two-component system, OmpR family, phosphate regulon response regulator PhoB